MRTTKSRKLPNIPNNPVIRRKYVYEVNVVHPVTRRVLNTSVIKNPTIAHSERELLESPSVYVNVKRVGVSQKVYESLRF